jgi:hypothetical protein
MIDPNEVNTVFRDCLFREEEVKDGQPIIEPVKVEGIVNTFGLHPERVKGHTREIAAWLDQLPNPFQEKMGGGASFLNSCTDKHGEQWTGVHRTMEQLMCLGMAIGRVRFVLPRGMWGALPGGMPYFVVMEGTPNGG